MGTSEQRSPIDVRVTHKKEGPDLKEEIGARGSFDYNLV
jgi:hypothetical protein